MSENVSPSERPAATGSQRSLVDRVRDRVLRANRALERRDTATRPRIRPPSVQRRAKPSAETSRGTPLSRESRALRTVFRDLAVTHQRYRQRTGELVSPALRDAARAFKHEPSLLSLVPVAGFLDELKLLEW
jgi:hypothetical protein